MSDFTFVHDVFFDRAALHPEHTALRDNAGLMVSYRELAHQAGDLSRRLQGLGVGPDDCVAVWMERSPGLIAAILAVTKSGGAYLPIDAAYPEERVAAILRGAGARLLISDRDVPQCVADLRIPTIGPECIDAETARDTAAASGLDPDHLAYVNYTSGSTGAPKGVAMSHRGLTRLIRWQVESGPTALLTLQFTPACFDVIFQEVFSTLCAGGTLLLIPQSVRRDAEGLLEMVARNSVQRIFLPYVALQQLAKAYRRTGILPSALRHVVTAGERLIVTDAIAAFFAALPDCRLENHYGPTETHLVTHFALPPDRASWADMPAIGRAVGGVTLRIFDSNLAPAPAGEPGELYVGGDGLARGYLNASDLTAERFLPDPLASNPGSRIYHTGDLVRTDADGLLHFLGRSDNQVKVRGFRVEPAAVELALADYPRVHEACVALRTLAPDVEGLVAYLVCEGGPIPVSELLPALQNKLPAYMIPSRFVFLDRLPTTPSGKVDYGGLPAIETPVSPVVPASAGTPLIEVVKAIWIRVLGHDEILADDDFFDVGGDSLLATWVVAELSQALGREVELSLFLRDSTLNGIVEALDVREPALLPARQSSEIITLRPGPSHRALHLLHPLGGELLAYRDLARSIQAPLRILGLRWRADAEERTILTLEEIAAMHLAQIRALQPSGPYLVAGWSFGGVLAFEVARQIVADGQEVEFLGLLDANPVRDPLTGVRTAETPYLEHLTRVLSVIESGAVEARGVLAQITGDPYVFALLGNNLPLQVTPEHLRNNLRITRDSLAAAMRYRAGPYRGRIELFQPDEPSPEIRESLAAELRSIAGERLQIHPVRGDHYSILRSPGVSGLAEALDRTLETARAVEAS